jgi:hypothetical protein
MKILLFFTLLLCSFPSFAFKHTLQLGYGRDLYHGFWLFQNKPAGIRAYRIEYLGQDEAWVYKDLAWYVSVSGTRNIAPPSLAPHPHTLNAFALAPVLRWHVLGPNTGFLTVFLTASVGVSYLSSVYFSNRKLGLHFAFQDMMGFGFYLGSEQKVFLTFQGLHYSNAEMVPDNNGISISVLSTLGYTF